jgi:hypothetical protein
LEQEEDDTEVELDALEIRSFNNFWGWFGTLITLANEDITKIDQITTYPLVFVLNYLSYMKDVNEIKRREEQKLRQKYKM